MCQASLFGTAAMQREKVFFCCCLKLSPQDTLPPGPTPETIQRGKTIAPPGWFACERCGATHHIKASAVEMFDIIHEQT